MHDVTAAQTIARSVLDVARERGAERIEVIRLELGAMQMIQPDQLSFWLEQILRGTIGEDAQVQIEHLPLRVTCEACGYEGEVEVPDDPIYHLMPYVPTCPQCGAEELSVIGGNECTVQSIRVTGADEDEADG